MTLDINKDNPSIQLTYNENVFPVYEHRIEESKELYTESWEVKYPFRYTVHREKRGFFTPMVYDALFNIQYIPGYLPGIKLNFEQLIEPFVEGALFVDDDSPILPLLLKGQEHGINRKEMVEYIKSLTKYEYCGIIDPDSTYNGKGIPWYSDSMVPPPTIQGNRLYVYDMDDTKHGSRLDPSATLLHLVEQWGRITKSVSSLMRGDLPVSYITSIEITAGYTSPVTVHKD